MSIFLSVDYFDEASIKLFWQKVNDSFLSNDVDIYLNYEASSIEAISIPQIKLLATLFAFEQGTKWDNIAKNEELSDRGYTLAMNKEIKKIFELLRINKPQEITNIKYLSNWYGDYTYSGMFLKHMEK